MTIEAMGITTPAPSPILPSPTETATLPSALPSPVEDTASPLPPTPALTATVLPTTLTPTATPLPPLPFSAVQIISPGPASRVISPFLVSTLFLAGPKGLVRLELLGEDGRLLMREVRTYDASPYAQVNAGFEVTFEIPGVAEAGRVQIAVEDKAGRIMALASTEVILLAIGETEINPPGDFLENIVIEQPLANALIQGGTVRVSGLARPRGAQPLMIELQLADGRVVGSRQVAVTAQGGRGFESFSIEVPYTVTVPTYARLVIWERGERIPGIIHLSSVEVLLSP